MFVVLPTNKNSKADLSSERLCLEVKKIAEHIKAGKNLIHDDREINKLSFQVFDQKAQNSHSIEIIEDLNAVLKKSIERGVDTSLEKELNIIRQLRDQIIKGYPIKDDLVSTFIQDPLKKILSNLSSAEYRQIRTVSKTWNAVISQIHIQEINAEKLPLCLLIKQKNAPRMLDFLLAYPAIHFLEYANFQRIEEFDDTCFKRLAENCFHLRFLILFKADINSLKYLAKLPNLEKLNITSCLNLKKNSLKHLKNTPKLKSLNIGGTHLAKNSLENLKFIPKLESLNLVGMVLEEKSLDNLKFTPNLKYLNMRASSLEDGDDSQYKLSLEGLLYTKELELLNISDIYVLKENSLDQLKFTPNLKHLVMKNTQLIESALVNLIYTEKLESLDISFCNSLNPDTIRYTLHMPYLAKINITHTLFDKEWLKQNKPALKIVD